MDALTLVILIVLVGMAIDLLILTLAKVLPKRVESDVKVMRYEAGNVPSGKPKSKLPFQYIPYLILFLSVEPIAVIVLLLSPFRNLPFIAIAFAILVPALIGGVKLAEGVGN